ncbi:MAG: bile acid:sodium symporter [Syntrophomonas sp.]|nr:bile acid:sodium symporter [Syntrophomonas sp.]
MHQAHMRSASWFLWPSRNLSLAIFLALLMGFGLGLVLDTTPLQRWLLPLTFIMIYPSMIGFKANEIFSRSHGRILAAALLLNFLAIPLSAYLLGLGFLLSAPQLFAGLAIAALLPTSNMTISFTMLAGGNVPASVKMTTFGLLLGAILAPWYLYLMVGKYIPVDILATFKTVGMVILVPLALGMLTYQQLLKRYSQEQFQQQIKPLLPAISSWGMMLLIIISISMNSQALAARPDLLAMGLGVQLVFYAVNYVIAVLVARRFFPAKDGLTLVFSTVLRNLGLSIGLAATAFGPDAAMMVSLAILLQGQAAAWFIKLNRRYGWLGGPKLEAVS